MTTATDTPAAISYASQPKPAPAPGIYHGVPAEEYHSWRAWNASTLSKCGSKTLADIRLELDAPTPQTPVMYFGNLSHTFVLERSRFDALNVVEVAGKIKRVWVEGGKQTERGLSLGSDPETLAGYREEYPDQTPMGEGWMDRLEAMRAAVHANPYARELIGDETPETTEVSLVWEHPKSGMPCKARLDKLVTDGAEVLLIDLKTTDSLLPRDIERTFARFEYHVKIGWYALGLTELGVIESPLRVRPQFVLLTKEAPFHCTVASLDTTAFADGIDDAEAFAEWLMVAEHKDDWPGYPQRMHVHLPQWALMAQDRRTDPWTLVKRAEEMAGRALVPVAEPEDHPF